MKRFIARCQATMILGLIVIVMPLTGFPAGFRTAVILIASILIVAFSYLNYRTVKAALTKTDL